MKGLSTSKSERPDSRQGSQDDSVLPPQTSGNSSAITSLGKNQLFYVLYHYSINSDIFFPLFPATKITGRFRRKFSNKNLPLTALRPEASSWPSECLDRISCTSCKPSGWSGTWCSSITNSQQQRTCRIETRKHRRPIRVPGPH